MSQSIVKTCNFEYELATENKESYNFSWNKFDPSYSPSDSYSNSYKAFQYQKASDLNTSSFSGEYGNYFGGGFAYKIDPGNHKSSILRDLSTLKSNNWIDKNTRAILLEFSLYNPNINHIAYCTILFEYLPTGNLIKSFRFQPFTLAEDISSLSAKCAIIYITFIFVFVFIEINNLRNKKFKELVYDFWFYVEWILIIFSWVSFAMYLYRLFASYQVSNKLQIFFSEKKTSELTSLHTLAYWNTILTDTIAICSFIGTIKLLKLLKISQTIVLLSRTLQKSLLQLLNLLFIFFLIWFAFINAMYLYMHNQIRDFRTLLKTFETTSLIIIGKLNKHKNKKYCLCYLNI